MVESKAGWLGGTLLGCVQRIVRLCDAGGRFFGEKVDLASFERMLTLFFEELGIRATNKFWALEEAFPPMTL